MLQKVNSKAYVWFTCTSTPGQRSVVEAYQAGACANCLLTSVSITGGNPEGVTGDMTPPQKSL